jgi:hypothetical protein
MNKTDPEIGEMECKNIRSRRHPTDKCKSPATHGDYCGRHFRNPTRWRLARGALRRVCTPFTTETREAGTAIANALKFRWRLRALLRHGPARFDRTLSNNTSDLVSCEEIAALKGSSLFSYRDPTDSYIYAFDIRSIHSLVHHARLEAVAPLNPYTRAELPTSVVDQCDRLVTWCRRRGITIEWAPLTPPTPEQQWNMKIVELFHQINELHYYSSPEWFLSMDESDHRAFYRELYEIWTYRAFLTTVQKNTIVPDYQRRLFQRTPLHIPDMLEGLQRLNRSIIKQLISSAEDIQDRVLGAMYVISAFTIVNEEARAAYPWLYESLRDVPLPPVPPHRPFRFLSALLDGLLGREAPPPLALPPPA